MKIDQALVVAQCKHASPATTQNSRQNRVFAAVRKQDICIYFQIKLL